MISYMLAGTASIVMILTLLRSFLLQQKKIEKQFWRIIIKTGKVGRFLYKLYVHTNNQLKSMSTNGNIIWYFAFSLIILFLNAAQFFLLFKTVAIPPPIASGYTAILISLSMMIIAFIPSAPGNIGVLHYGVYSVLIFVSKSYDIPSNKMLLANYALFGIYAHLSFFLPEIIIGIIILQSELWGKNEKINIWFLKKYFPPFL